MSNNRYDGSVESFNTPISIDSTDDATYRCMITNVYYKDSKLNITKNSPNPQVLYEAVILGGFSGGQIISNARLSNFLGGQYNYSERVLRKSSKPLNSTRLQDQDGDIVYIEFIQGNPKAAVIIGLGTQPLDGDNTGATISDGPRLVQQYNGVNELINKNGEWIVTRKGGTYDSDSDVFTPVEDGTFEAKISLVDDSIVIEDGVSSITITKSADKMVLNSSNIELGDELLEFIVKSTKLKDYINNEIRAIYEAHQHLGNLGFLSSTPMAPNDTMTVATESLLGSLKHKVE